MIFDFFFWGGLESFRTRRASKLVQRCLGRFWVCKTCIGMLQNPFWIYTKLFGKSWFSWFFEIFMILAYFRILEQSSDLTAISFDFEWKIPGNTFFVYFLVPKRLQTCYCAPSPFQGSGNHPESIFGNFWKKTAFSHFKVIFIDLVYSTSLQTVR